MQHDAHARQELEDRREQAKARTKHRDGNDLDLDRDRIGLGQRCAHLAASHRQVCGRFVQQERDHLAREDAKFFWRRGGVAQSSQAVRDERVLTDA